MSQGVEDLIVEDPSENMSEKKRIRELSSEEGCDASEDDGMSRRLGQWTVEEENYADQLSRSFLSGCLIDCCEFETLRSYLASKLNCSKMRISKKFAGRPMSKV